MSKPPGAAAVGVGAETAKGFAAPPLVENPLNGALGVLLPKGAEPKAGALGAALEPKGVLVTPPKGAAPNPGALGVLVPNEGAEEPNGALAAPPKGVCVLLNGALEVVEPNAGVEPPNGALGVGLNPVGDWAGWPNVGLGALKVTPEPPNGVAGNVPKGVLVGALNGVGVG